jgi:amino acid adenylation domain-containing protein
MPGAVRLTGQLNVDALARSLNEVIRRHEILRTTFATRRNQPLQVIAPPWTISLSVTDLRDLSETDREDVVQSLIADEARRGFDLLEGPLFRTALLRLSEEDHVLLLTMHHIISDGWSIGVLIREITALYQAYSEGADSPLTALPIQYADFAVWQRQCLEGEAMQAQISYWRQQLQDSPPLLELPIDYPRPAIQTFRGASLPLVLSESLSAALKALSRGEDVTLFMTLFAAFATLLNRYTEQDDIAVGSPIAGRTQVEVESLIGCFVNTLVLRADLSGDPSFTELLGRVKEMALAAYAHQDLPFEKLVEELQPERNLNRTPLFQVMFVMQNAQDAALKLPGLELTRLEVSSQTAKFDLTLALEESASGLSGSLQYNTDLFDAESIARMGQHFRTLLQGIADNPRQRLSSLPLLTEEEQHDLLVRWNDTATEYPAQSCLHWLFEAQAEQTPHAIAVVFGNEEVTYKDLNTRANKFAHHLRALGVGPEVLVGLMAKRSVEMVVGVLAILKAGGAYLPLEPEYPDERLSFMLTDSGASVLLAQSTLASRFADFTGTVVSLDEQPEASETFERARSVTPENLAYVIYTSGSTGQPKGVEVTHASVCNHLRWRQSAYPLSASDSFLQKASISFDISVWEIFAPLLAGARLVLAEPGGQRDSAYLGRLIAEKQITVAHFHPAMLRAVLQEPDAARWTSLRQVFCGGETLPRDTQRLFFDTVSAGLCHQYGPTETTIDVAAWDCLPDDARAVIPIGQPIGNTRLYVLDGELRPVPVGLPGELYVGGVALARAYLNRPGLTAERFVPDPFSPEPGGRLYRTGDHARWLSDGVVQFLGRADAQVKVRGYRVELGEIEAALASHPGVREAAATVHVDAGGERRLVGYVVARSERQPSISELRNFLLAKLPDYMAPSSFVFLDSLPLTASGKVNRQALPLPDQSRPELDQAFVAPQTPAEQMIAGVWREVLGTEQIGVDDNFFELGGHSLLATQVVGRLSEAFGFELPLRAIFESPTIAGLSEKIATAVRSEQNITLPPILPVSRDQDLPLSFPQERLWLLHQLHPMSVAYHVLRPLQIIGTLDVKLLERVLTEVVSRHEVYRTNIVTKQGRPVQIINPPQPIELPVTDLSGLSREEREEQVQHLIAEEGQRPFNLAHGPLWRLTLLRLDEAEHLLMLTEHHVVHDGWTEGRLVLDFLALYAATATGQPSPLPELSIQYADFAYWQRHTIQGELLESLLSYWKEQLADSPPMLELPGDFPRPAVMSFRGANSTWQFTPELTTALNVLSRREGATLYMTLLTAFNVLLHRYTRQEDLVIGTPIANRNHIETELLTGFFANTLVMRNDLSGKPGFKELLGRVREVALGAYMHQDMPFERLVEELQPDRALNRQPLFQVMFVLQNAPNPPVELPGLTVETLRVHNGTSKFDLLLAMREDRDQLTAAMEYNTDIFEEKTIQRMLQHFQNLLEAIVANPDQRISALSLMKEAERQQLLVDWNNTEFARREDRNIVQLFEDQVERTPDAVALMFQGESLTYKKLNERANQLAHFLQARGVGPEVFVGICMQRSVEMMVSVLGVLKAGGAYLPLDPTYPKERLAYMIGDTKAHLLLTQHSLLEVLPEHSAQVVCLDSYWKIIAQEKSDNPAPVVAPENLVYVTYTSGSTGKPKGIGMIQRSLLNLLDWMCRTTQLPAGARTVQFASLSFDVSFQDMFSTWFSGGTLVLLTEDERRDIVSLSGVLNSNDVNRIFIPAVALQQLAEGLCAHDPQTSQLRRVIAGSEQLHVTQPIAKFFSQSKDCSLHNEYGPSETHVVTALSLPASVTSWPSRPPIGRPISNTQIYLLEESLQPAPIGVPGELYIGGVGLARGYLGRPDLTAEKFLPDPFSHQPGARFYRTGDLARYQPDGNIEFLGRKDHQVKIRGFRIELGEIETVLGQHPAVQETIVLTWERRAGDRQLVAYVVFQPGSAPSISEMRNFLLQTLPDYMAPASFIFLDSLPLTANGKVNRQALPLPDQARPELDQAFVAPQTPLEQVIAGVWREVLGTEQIGVDDNFFELGGHSLLATQVVGRLSEAFEFELPLRTVFESPTIAGLAASMVQLEPAPGNLEAVAQLLLEFAQLSEEDAQSLLDVDNSHKAEDQTEISVG